MLSDKVKNSLICFLVFYLIVDWGGAMIIYGKQPHLMSNVVKNLKNTKFLAIVAFGVLACVLLHRYALSSDETAEDSDLHQEEEMQTLMESPEHYYNYENHGDDHGDEHGNEHDDHDEHDQHVNDDSADNGEQTPPSDASDVSGPDASDAFTDFAPF